MAILFIWVFDMNLFCIVKPHITQIATDLKQTFKQTTTVRPPFGQFSTILSLEGVGKPHINIRWSDDGSDENERIYRYRLDCGLIVSARGTPQPSGDPRVHFPKKMVFRWVAL
mgnify:CR=1 FL=1